MPALPSASKVIKASFFHVLGDALVANILHWAYAGSTASVADLDTLAADFATAWANNMMAHLTDNLVLGSVKLTDLTSDTSAVGEWTGSHAGGEPNAGVTANTAIVLSHKISRRYRGGHPRTYIAGVLPAAFGTPQQLTSGNVTQFTNDFEAFRSAVAALSTSTTTPLTLVNLSYYTGKALRATPLTDTILATICQDRVCSQRRRSGPLVAE